jgi:hypothetical protein
MIIVSQDDLKRLEASHGPNVWNMGAWNSDGVFGYAAVPLEAVRQAAEKLSDPGLNTLLARLKDTPERTRLFLDLLRFYPALTDRIVAVYRRSYARRYQADAAAAVDTTRVGALAERLPGR